MTASCRRTQPSLIDRNQPPDTQLWYAPPDSSDYEYKVHMYWRGIDDDGTARRFIWAIQDTIVGGGLSWNPALRIRDYRLGRITSRTDSVFSFTAYKDVAGVGVRKNRQAFFVAAIDDNGVIDPDPAAVEFVATIGELPRIHFTNHIEGVARPYRFTVPPRDTVGMYHPFEISFHGTTSNGLVRGYQYFPISSNVVIPGSGIWFDSAGADTTVEFENTVANPIPAGTFRFAAKCIDDAGAQSQVDAGQYREGVAQIVVNFDPDTWLTDVRYSAFFEVKPDIIQQPVNYTDNVPDTIPNRGWITVFYYSHDDSRDTRLCSIADPDECIDFNVRVVRTSARLNLSEDSNWLPPSPAEHDSDGNSTSDSNSVNIGTFEYKVMASGTDENGTRDGTPPIVSVVGNFDPTMDTFEFEDHIGNVINTTGPLDTLVWDFHKGVGWPYDAEEDTLQSDGVYFKEFGFRFLATGHDDIRDPDGSAVKAWRYQMYTGFNNLNDRGTPIFPFGRSGPAWIPGDGPDTVNELAKQKYRYTEADGNDIFSYQNNDLSFVNQVITLVVYGRDTAFSGEPNFSQNVYWDQLLFNSNAGDGVSDRNLINEVNTTESGRWTQPKIVKFYLKFRQ
jgi:hypothetical protein